MGSYATFEDAELARLLYQGDERAFAEIYARYKTVLFLHARRILEDDDASKDVVQEIFTTLWTKKQELQFTTSLKSYLFSATKNKVLNLLMHKKHVDKYMESMKDVYKAGNYVTDQAIMEKELSALIESEIQLLPTRMKEVFILSRKEDLSYKQIAQKMLISEETVKKQISYALKILRLKVRFVILIAILSSFFY